MIQSQRVQTQRTLLAMLAIVALVVFAHLMEQAQFGRTNVVMVYMLAVVTVAAMLGLWPALAASLLGLPLFDVFDVPPHFALNQSVLTHTFPLGVMLATAVIVSSLAGRLRQQVAESEERVTRTAALYALAADLAADMTGEEVLKVTARHVAHAFDRPVDTAHLEAEGLPALLRRLPEGRNDEHLQAMFRLAEQALERAALRQRVRVSELRAQQESLRSSVLGAVSHDLRTPLASIIGASSTLIDEGDGFTRDARLRLQRVIYDESVQMLRMVENLLDYARLRSGGVGSENAWQAFEEIVGSALASMRRREPTQRFLVDVPGDLPLLRCDGVLMERVLVNLLENAGRHAPPGSAISIVVRAGAGMLSVAVSDEGPGIPAGLREKIFEPFFRSGSAGGSGLGLAICRGIVEAHGGSIQVGDSPGGGAQLVFTLPLSVDVPALRREDVDARPA